jgi:hypothetical protein
MAAARTLMQLGDTDRALYLCDTFAGMTKPTSADAGPDHDAEATRLHWEQMRRADDTNDWTFATLSDVRANMASTGYPSEQVSYVQGPVEETLPDEAPDAIAILRLDTDWYESTRHELEHLYDRVPSGGVLIIDDYGTWQGARQAVDEFLERTGARLLLHPVAAGRIAVKP